MAAVEGDGDRTDAQQVRQIHELSPLVRESEIRHGIADLWCRSADIGCRQPHHQAIHGVLHRRAQSARLGREHVEPLAQGGIHVTAIEECLFERMEDWNGDHRTVPIAQTSLQRQTPGPDAMRLHEGRRSYRRLGG